MLFRSRWARNRCLRVTGGSSSAVEGVQVVPLSMLIRATNGPGGEQVLART
jgi:hypothetical protein